MYYYIDCLIQVYINANYYVIVIKRYLIFCFANEFVFIFFGKPKHINHFYNYRQLIFHLLDYLRILLAPVFIIYNLILITHMPSCRVLSDATKDVTMNIIEHLSIYLRPLPDWYFFSIPRRPTAFPKVGFSHEFNFTVQMSPLTLMFQLVYPRYSLNHPMTLVRYVDLGWI